MSGPVRLVCWLPGVPNANHPPALFFGEAVALSAIGGLFGLVLVLVWRRLFISLLPAPEAHTAQFVLIAECLAMR